MSNEEITNTLAGFVSGDPQGCAEDVAELGVWGALHYWQDEICGDDNDYKYLFTSKGELEVAMAWVSAKFQVAKEG